ncbi:hypothetical protein VV01_14760 [Luteipulveratus halotolerans]|uniref:Lipoprotein n=1 Tax=Luteipulveratus halotolerans TaxID=1631356 RepID=A0A0L6CJZ3_9MICO|nr:hypothetical protein VV01_14760 [Luteipulveratus halotolerans]
MKTTLATAAAVLTLALAGCSTESHAESAETRLPDVVMTAPDDAPQTQVVAYDETATGAAGQTVRVREPAFIDSDPAAGHVRVQVVLGNTTGDPYGARDVSFAATCHGKTAAEYVAPDDAGVPVRYVMPSKRVRFRLSFQCDDPAALAVTASTAAGPVATFAPQPSSSSGAVASPRSCCGNDARSWAA